MIELPQTELELTQWVLEYSDHDYGTRGTFLDCYINEFVDSSTDQEFDELLGQYNEWIERIQVKWPALCHYRTIGRAAARRLFLSGIPVWLEHLDRDWL